jgi:hypothetical protein
MGSEFLVQKVCQYQEQKTWKVLEETKDAAPLLYWIKYARKKIVVWPRPDCRTMEKKFYFCVYAMYMDWFSDCWCHSNKVSSRITSKVSSYCAATPPHVVSEPKQRDIHLIATPNTTIFDLNLGLDGLKNAQGISFPVNHLYGMLNFSKHFKELVKVDIASRPYLFFWLGLKFVIVSQLVLFKFSRAFFSC